MLFSLHHIVYNVSFALAGALHTPTDRRPRNLFPPGVFTHTLEASPSLVETASHDA